MRRLDFDMESGDSPMSQKRSDKSSRIVRVDNIDYRITCPNYDNCSAPKYNNGVTKYLCSENNHSLCATVKRMIEHREGVFSGNVRK